jgi:glycosyltransferase involved in cell wall biosynthesis
MENNSFSVIIPTRTREKLLARAVNSILNQTYDNFECIVVDDHSTDGTKARIENEFGDFPCIEYISTESVYPGKSNRYYTRNAGMKTATKDWICWLDDDDEYASIYLEAVNDAINEFPDYKVFNFAALVHHNKKNGGKAYYKYSTVRGTFKPAEAEVGHIHFESGGIGSGSFVFHRSILDEIGYLPEVTHWWDAAEVAQIPGYGQHLRPLGNPWGDDYYMFYKITRKFKSKSLDLILYIQHTR